MQAFGMLLLAAATAGDGFGYSDPGVGLKKWLRPHVVTSADATGAPPYNASLAGGGRRHGRRQRAPVHQSPRARSTSSTPTACRSAGRPAPGPTARRTYLPAQLTVPARYNFNQGYIYRLKITNIPGRPAPSLYPTIEVAPTTPGDRRLPGP